MTFEDWRAVTNFEGVYEVSNLGKVRSLTRIVNSSKGVRTVLGKLVKSRIDLHGYEVVSLCKNNKLKIICVHILVAQAFLDVPKEGQNLVNHKDTIKNHNWDTNLEWVTSSENNLHAAYTVKKATLKAIRQLDLAGTLIAEYPSASMAARAVHTSASNICEICKGKGKTLKGYKWQYKQGGDLYDL